MADTKELRMNVAALKRVDPYARDIVDSATHVALYTFEENEWEKTSIEGALFVYSRNGEPYHSMVIMNRLNTNNLIEPVSAGLELQLQEPFMLYRNSRGHIFGIWFYDKEECVRVSTKLTGLAKDSSKFTNSKEKMPLSQAVASSSNAGGPVDIFSMLSKAQDAYNSIKGGSSTNNEPQAPRAPDLTSQSVMDFFAKAGGSGVQLPQAPPVHAGNMFTSRPPPTADVAPLVLHRLMSNPAHSVEHIEKQQRSITPQDMMLNDSSGDPFKQNHLGYDKRKESCGKLNRIKNQKSGKVIPNDGHIDMNGSGNVSNDLGFLRIASPKSSSPLASFLSRGQDNVTDELRPLSAPVPNETPQKPALMPPTMFTSSAHKETPARSESDVRPEPLTRNQLLQAFNYLIKHDAEFVNKLHEAYVKSFSELVL